MRSVVSGNTRDERGAAGEQPPCTACGHGSPTGARFCEACGGDLSQAWSTCRSCGHVGRPKAAYCILCGARLARPPRPGECFQCGAAHDPGDGFCRVCGARLFNRSASHPEATSLVVTSLSPEPAVAPVAHMNTESKAPWYEILDDLPQFASFPPGIEDAMRGVGERRSS